MTAVTPDAPSAGRARRGRWAALLATAGALVGVVALPVWVVAEGSSALDEVVTVTVTGAQAAPQTRAAALVLLAAGAAVALVGRVGRWAVAVVTAAAGVLVAAGGATVLSDPARAVSGAVVDATGVAEGSAAASTTAGPVVALVVGLLVVLLAAALAHAPGAWDQRSRRYDRQAARDDGPGDGPPDERADWDALTRGDDPS